jgi:hypothetical protein
MFSCADIKRAWRAAAEFVAPGKHLMIFVVLLSLTTVLKSLVCHKGLVPPALAAWELAALLHVFLTAQKLMSFSGFSFASKRFNSVIKKVILNGSGGFVVLKLGAIALETQDTNKGKERLLMLGASAKPLADTIHRIAPYILMLPLAFFFIINLVAFQNVRMNARSLSFPRTEQEEYLSGLIRFVDLPVLLPFVVMLVFLKWVDPVADKEASELIFGTVGCCLLIVSNLLAGVFDEHWSELRKERSEWT